MSKEAITALAALKAVKAIEIRGQKLHVLSGSVKTSIEAQSLLKDINTEPHNFARVLACYLCDESGKLLYKEDPSELEDLSIEVMGEILKATVDAFDVKVEQAEKN